MRWPLSLFSKLNKPCILSHSSLGMLSHLFSTFLALFWTYPNIFISLHCGVQNCTQYLRWDCTHAEYSGTITSFHRLAILYLTHPKIGLSLLGTRAHCWLVLILPSIKTPTFLPAWLHTGLIFPSLYVHAELFWSRCRIWHLFYIYIIECIYMYIYMLT